ncbi:MAG TPA: PAS domain S-box protein, partial [Ktedonobacterales bacterium]
MGKLIKAQQSSIAHDISPLGGKMHPSDHAVQFYETDDFLVEALSGFVREGLDAGEACVVVAAQSHLSPLVMRMEASQLDIASAQAHDALIWLDADETLARFMVNGMPHTGRFVEVIGGIIARAAMRGRHVRVFGEMVAELWRQENQAAALRLEELWNELRDAVQPFSLCCAYPMGCFAGEGNLALFTEICDEHVRVIPTETYSTLTESDERLRTISLLQQKAHTLEVEVAERRAVEARLRASENRYRRLFEASTDGILLVDPNTQTVIDANPVMADLLGYAYGQLLGRELWQIGLFPDEHSTLAALVELEQKQFLRYEALPLQTSDGQRRYVEFVSNRFKANGSDVIQCNVRDITDRKRLEQEIVSQAGQITATFEALTDGLLVFDAGGHLVQMNSAARTLLKLDAVLSDYSLPTEGSSRFEIRDEQGRPLPAEEWPIRRVLRGDVLAGTSAVDVIIRTLDGHERQLNITGAPALGEHGRIIGGVCIMHDVTERRRLEQQTRRALSALLQMAEALVHLPAADEVMAAPDQPPNENLVVQRLATLTQAVLGCERATLAAIHAESGLIHLVASAGLSDAERREWHRVNSQYRLEDYFGRESLAQLRAGEAVVTDDESGCVGRRLAHAAGQALIVPIRLGEHLVGILCLGYDEIDHHYTPDEVEFAAAVAKLAALVLERERLLHERAEAEAQLLALLKTNGMMNEFLGIASHELRTPLTVIRANVQLLEKTLERLFDTSDENRADPAHLRERAVALTTRIKQQSLRQERLVNDLLDVSRIEAGRLELHVVPTDLAAIVRESVDEQRLLNEQRRISLNLPRDFRVVPVCVDADSVGQVITNFLTNALKYSASDQPVSVSLALHGDTARVSVRDHGPGLSPEMHMQIWDRFYRAPGVEVQSGSGVGLGLGLYISKTIIERLG